MSEEETRYRVGDYEFGEKDIFYPPNSYTFEPDNQRKKSEPHYSRCDMVEAEGSEGEDVVLKINRYDFQVFPFPLQEHIEALEEVSGEEHPNLITPVDVLDEPIYYAEEGGGRASQERRILLDRDFEEAEEQNYNRLVEVYDERTELPIVTDYFREAMRKGDMGLETGLCIARDIAEAASNLHSRGIVHHDIELRNVFFDPEDEEAHLFDLNDVSYPYEHGGLDRDSNQGKYWELAPEFVEGQLDRRYDVWRMGRALVRLVHHHLDLFLPDEPWPRGIRKRAEEDATRNEVPEVVNDIIYRAARLDPEERYDSCIEMLEDLEDLL